MMRTKKGNRRNSKLKCNQPQDCVQRFAITPAEGQHRGDQERDGGGDSGEEHGAGPGHKCHLVLLGGDGQMDRDDGVVGQRLGGVLGARNAYHLGNANV